MESDMEDITNEKAKEVLDFIAQKKGCLYMSVRKLSWKTSSYAPYVETACLASPLWIDFKDSPTESMMLEYSSPPNWKEILSDLLYYASKPDTLRISDGSREPIMKNGECLEHILVEMDLHSSLENEQEKLTYG